MLNECGETIRCSLRGRYKKEFELKKNKQSILDIVCVNDNVDYEDVTPGVGVINTIYKRKNYISRKAPKIKGATFRGERLEQVIASNIDLFFIVSSVESPKFNNKVIDRFLVIAESSNIIPIIVINKCDLFYDEEVKFWEKLYKNIGYNVFVTSTETGKNIKKLSGLIKGKTSIFWGQSGVGKSSLINKLFPELNLRVGEISDYNNKGRHTTVSVNLYLGKENSNLIDTPGIREIDPFGIKKEDLSHYFLEFNKHRFDCRFNTCTHNHEPGCAIDRAVESGEISPERYDSYLSLLNTIEDDMLF